MNMLTIYAADHTTQNPHIRCVVEKFQFSDTFMGEQYVMFDYQSEDVVQFSIGDYCVYRGEQFVLNYEPSTEQNARPLTNGAAFTYKDIKFNSVADELTRCEMLDVVLSSGEHEAAYGTNYTGSADFSIGCYETTFTYGYTTYTYCSVHALLDYILANLIRLYGTTDGQPYDGTNSKWKIYIDDSKCHTDDFTVTLSHWTVAQALAEVHNTFKLDYVVRGRKIIVGDISSLIATNPDLKGIIGDLSDINDDGHAFYFGYGKGNNSVGDDGKGLFKITRTADSEQQIVTRLRAVGSAKNMPYNYYFKNYDLPQTMYLQNLQLPDTFLPMTGSVVHKRPSDPSNKTAGNANRDAAYGAGVLRHVLGDTNDAYIDKGDDAASCAEGIREASARWDGSDSELPEIYPTIAEGTYNQLRAANVPDQDGTTGINAFPNYGGTERIDTILALGEKVNYGDGKYADADVIDRRATEEVGDAVIAERTIGVSQSDDSSLLFTTVRVYEPSDMNMAFTNGSVRLFAHIDATYTGQMLSWYVKRRMRYKVHVYKVAGNSETEIATFTSVEHVLCETGRSDYEPFALDVQMPDFGNGANGAQPEQGSWDVDELVLDESAQLRTSVEIQLLGEYETRFGYDIVIHGVEWRVGDQEGSEIAPHYIVNYADVETEMNTPFYLILKDNGIDWTQVEKIEDDIKICMKSGQCAGHEFSVLIGDDDGVEKTVRNTRKGWKIKLQRDDDSSNYAYYPNQYVTIQPDDEYVVTGIKLPDAYIREAELRLLEAATAYLADNCETNYTYQPSIDDIYLQRDIDKNEALGTPEKSIYWRLYAGLTFPFRGIPVEAGGNTTLPFINITIEQVTIHEGEKTTPQVEVKLNDDIQQSALDKIKIAVDRIYNTAFFGNGGSGRGGSSSSNLSLLLEILDSEGGKLFLRKDEDDATPHTLTMGGAKVTGAASVGGKLDVGRGITAGGGVTSGGDLSVAGTTDLQGNAAIGGNASILGNEEVGGTAEFEGHTQHKNGLDVNFTGNDLQGSGAQIDSDGNIIAESLYARSFIGAPEYRFNKITVTEGEQWNTNGFGVIESVEQTSATAGSFILHLEEGEYPSIVEGDFCRGIYNAMAAGVTLSQTEYSAVSNPTGSPIDHGWYEKDANDEYHPSKDASIVSGKTYYIRFDGSFDECGFLNKYGFFTSYFYVTRVANIAGEGEPAKYQVDYILRTSDNPNFRNFHPVQFMKFAQYGNDIDFTRKSSSYFCSHPHSYEIIYEGVDQWEVTSPMITYIHGWLGGFSLKMKDGTYRTFKEGDHGLYVQKNIYFGENIIQLDPQTLEDIEEQLANYTIDMDIAADTVTVDAEGNVVGGLYYDTDDDGETVRHYRLYTNVIARKGNDYLVLPSSGTAGDGQYTFTATSDDCTVVKEGSRVYITAINHIRTGSETSPFDYDAMRAVKEVKVDIDVSCEGKKTLHKTYCVTVEHIDTAYISADMINERSLVSWLTKTQNWIGLPLIYQMQVWHNQEIISFNSIGSTYIADCVNVTATLNGVKKVVEVLSPASDRFTGDIGILKSFPTRTIGGKTYTIAQIQVAKLADGLEDGELRLTNELTVQFAGVTYVRTLDHVMQLASDVNVYSVLPSASEIVIHKDGTLSVNSVTCQVFCDSSDGTHYEVLPANFTTHGLKLVYKIDNGNETNYSGAVTIQNTNKNLAFRLYLLPYTAGGSSNVLMDEENVPVIEDGLDAPEMVVTPSVVMVDAKNDGSAYVTTLTATVRMMVGGNICQLTTSSFSATKPTGVTLGTFSTTNMGTLGQFSITIAANTAEANYKGNIAFSIEGGYAGKSYTGHGVIPISAAKKGDTGAIIRMRGVFVPNNTSNPYVNNESFIDVVVDSYDGYYYKLKDGVTSYSGATAPNASSSWQRASSIDFLATKVFITENGYGKVLGAGELWVGAAEEGVGVNGWIMKNAAIKHNVTGLELTADGYLNDPDGLHMKVGGKNQTNGNMLSNAYFDVLLTEIDDDLQIPEVYLAAVKNGGVHGPHVLTMNIESPGTAETRLMGGGTPMHGVHLNYQQHTFSIYARRSVYEDYAWVKLYKADNEEMTSNLTLLTTLSIPYSDTFKLLSYSFTPGGANKYFAFKVGMTSEDGGSYLYVDSVKLETGTSVTPMCDTSFDDKLLPTGIDIEKRKITLTADQLVCQNNSGEKTAWLDESGNFQTAGIQSSLIQAATDLTSFTRMFVCWPINSGEIEYVDWISMNQYASAQAAAQGGENVYDGTYQLYGADQTGPATVVAVSPVGNYSWILPSAGQGKRFVASLDMRCANGLIEVDWSPSYKEGSTIYSSTHLVITLPYLEVTGVNDSTYTMNFFRTPTRMNTGELHYITVDEIKQLIGRHLVISNNTNNVIIVHNGDASYIFSAGTSMTFDFVIEKVPGTAQTITGDTFQCYYPRYYWKPVDETDRVVNKGVTSDANFAKTFLVD